MTFLPKINWRTKDLCSVEMIYFYFQHSSLYSNKIFPFLIAKLLDLRGMIICLTSFQFNVSSHYYYYFFFLATPGIRYRSFSRNMFVLSKLRPILSTSLNRNFCLKRLIFKCGSYLTFFFSSSLRFYQKISKK